MSTHPRLQVLLETLPRDRQTILEIGARHGAVTRLLIGRFASVTALDLEKPAWSMERVTPVQGDVQQLTFPDRAFDCVICTEVLEHVPDVAAAARELQRVARHEIIVSVPYRQDTRVGRLTCRQCGGISPPYGHLNTFDDATLARLFAGSRLLDKQYIDAGRERTNWLSSRLHDFAGNPYGDYTQEEPCVHCGARFAPPPAASSVQRLAAVSALRLEKIQQGLVRPRPIWIQCVFSKGV